MAVTWARAVVQMDVDGDGVPRQVRFVAQNAARQGARAFNKRFNNDLDRNASVWKRFFGRALKPLGVLNSVWKRMSFNMRQVAAWTSVIVSVLPQAAALGVALTGVIIALGTAIAALGAGIGIAVAGFTGLFAEGAKLTEGAKATKAAFEGLTDVFKDLQQVIVDNMFETMGPSVENFGKALSSLMGPLATFATAVGDSINRIFDALSTPEAVSTLAALLKGFGPIFSEVVDLAIALGGALGGIMKAALVPTQQFIGLLADGAQKFSDFVNSAEGQQAILNIFRTMNTLLPPISRLLGTVGTMLATLVTPQVVQQAGQLLDAVSGLLTMLTPLIAALSSNVFAIFGAALGAISALLTPLLPIISQLAQTLSVMLVEGLEKLAPSFARLGEALVPIVTIIAELAIAVLPSLIDVIILAIDYVSGFMEVLFAGSGSSKDFAAAVKIMGDIVRTTFQILAAVIGGTMDFIIGTFKLVGQILRGDFTGAFKTMYTTVKDILARFGVNIDDVIKWVEDMMREVSNFFRDMGRNIDRAIQDIAGFIEGLWKPIQDAIGWFSSLFGAASSAQSAGSSAAGNRGGGGGGFAAGGILNGPRRILAGEAGPEAIVPLNRALSQVDPSVRWLSALAQGLGAPGMASGGIVGGGRSVTIAPGAVQVYEAGNSRQTAYDVLDVLANRIAG